jgi:hypothetical protein
MDDNCRRFVDIKTGGRLEPVPSYRYTRTRSPVLLQGKRSNNEAALKYFIGALGSFVLNVNSTRDMTPVGLYSCLMDLAKAVDTFAEHSILPRLNAKSIEHITYEFLIDALIRLRATSAFHAMTH